MSSYLLDTTLARVVTRSLANSRDGRYQSVADLLDELRNATATATKATSEPDVPSIAVLPFANMSADPEQEYFCDGLAEELIDALARLEGLRVVARTSAFRFRGDAPDLREVGEKLNVKTVLEGSVRKAGNRLRINAQLINAEDGYHLWSERYDRDMEDVFAVQDEIARTVVEKLKVKLFGKQDAPAVKRPTDNMDAYNAFLKGRFLMQQKEPVAMKHALVQFEHALSLDSAYAAAYAGVADATALVADQGVIDLKEANTAARHAAARALELDPRLVEPHITLGWRDMAYAWDQASAARHFAQALELGPDSAEAHSRYACYLAWMPCRFDEAVSEARRGVELDPMNVSGHTSLGIVLRSAGRLDEAIAALLHAVELDRTSWLAHHSLGQAYLAATRYQEAIDAYRAAIRLAGRHPWSLAEMGIAHVRSGDMGQGLALHEELVARSNVEFAAPTHLACLCGELGKTEQAFEFLERAYEVRDAWMIFLRFWHYYDSLRGDPRFDEMITRVGIG